MPKAARLIALLAIALPLCSCGGGGRVATSRAHASSHAGGKAAAEQPRTDSKRAPSKAQARELAFSLNLHQQDLPGFRGKPEGETAGESAAGRGLAREMRTCTGAKNSQ